MRLLYLVACLNSILYRFLKPYLGGTRRFKGVLDICRSPYFNYAIRNGEVLRFRSSEPDLDAKRD